MATGEVHWHEGLFLQPHHLQTMQRFFTERIGTQRKLLWSYPYGVVESRISNDALENLLVQFDQLHVVMPSGLEIVTPDMTDIPAIDIKPAFESGRPITIYLGVPLWYSERANTLDDGDNDWRIKRLYRVSEIERPDENTGENAQPMRIRHLNARLLLDDDDPSDLEMLPVLKIVHAAGEKLGTPRQDPNFIPPSLLVRGSTILRDLVRDLSNQVEASRKELVLQITRGGFHVDNMRGVQFEQMLRLQILNRFSARLPHLAEAPGVTPFDAYLELRELLACLACLSPDRDQFDATNYNHDNPGLAFHELSAKIRPLLRGAITPSFIKLEFEAEGAVLTVQLDDDHFTRPNEYYLGIKTKQEPQELARLVEDPDEFKLMARSLATRAIFGVRLSLERIPPLELPSETGLHFFRLKRGESARMWQRICDEKSISARWPSMEQSDMQLALYMTVPDMGGKE